MGDWAVDMLLGWLCIRSVRKPFSSLLGDEEVVFYPNTALAEEIDSGLAREDRIGLDRIVLVIVGIMDVEAKGVPDRVCEVVAVSCFGNEIASNLVVCFPAHTDANRTRSPTVRAKHNVVYPKHFRSRFFTAHKNRARDVGAIPARKPASEIDNDRLPGSETPRGGPRG